MERLVLLLLLASIAFLDAADSVQVISKGKYGHDKAPHGKEYQHEDKHKYDHAPSPKGYEHKHDGYSYRPEGYSYKPEGYNYKPEGYNYKPERYGYQPEAPYGYDPSLYSAYGYDYEHNPLNGKYGEPSPYDGGYWGGPNGPQVIHLQAIYPEGLLNTSLINAGSRNGFNPPPFGPCIEEDIVGTCAADFGVLCAWRHHEDQPSKYGDYATAKYGPIFQTEPTVPLAIGKGYWSLNPFVNPFVNLVTFNGHQRGYKFGDVTGFINFVAGADQCNPFLIPGTKVTFNSERVPVYLIFGKVKLPVDPAILLPLGGIFIGPDDGNNCGGVGCPGRTAKTQSADVKDDYKTTPEGNKYKVHGDTAYILNEKDNTLCGLSLVARGPATATRPAVGDDEPRTYIGSLTWPILWTDVITTLPLVVRDQVDPPAGGEDQRNFGVTPSFDIGALLGPSLQLYLEKTLDRVASICKSNDDIPWITPGSITLDLFPTPTPTP